MKTCFYCGKPLEEDQTVWTFIEGIAKSVPVCSDDRTCEPSMEAIFGKKNGGKKN